MKSYWRQAILALFDRNLAAARDALSAASDECNGRRVYETEDVRVFYGVEGVDACPDIDGRDVCLADQQDSAGRNVFAVRAGDAAQDTIDTLERLGFTTSVADHPWEGRKFQEGDSPWVGLTVMRIPELSKMRVLAKLMDVDDGRLAPGCAAARCGPRRPGGERGRGRPGPGGIATRAGPGGRDRTS